VLTATQGVESVNSIFLAATAVGTISCAVLWLLLAMLSLDVFACHRYAFTGPLAVFNVYDSLYALVCGFLNIH
jgi:uncharacterized protein with PQ loop repeat